MSNSLKRFQAWRSRRKQRRERRALEWWERIRAKGKARCVIQTALTYSLTGVGLTSVVGHFFGSQGISLETVIVYLFSGIVVGFDSWNTMEGKYKNALIDARVKASPSGNLPPHNNPLQNYG